MLRKPLTVLPLLAAAAATATSAIGPRGEANDYPRGAVPISFFGHGVLDYDSDPEWWRIGPGHTGSAWVQVDTGIGALCGCPKGDPFAPVITAYDKHGTMLGTVTSPGQWSYGLQLSGMPLGESVWLHVSGTMHGTHGYSEYSVLVF